MYIQDKVKEYADEVFERMDNGAHMYFCGLKGMMPGITDMLEGVSAKKGLVWADKSRSGRRTASGIKPRPNASSHPWHPVSCARCHDRVVTNAMEDRPVSGSCYVAREG